MPLSPRTLRPRNTTFSPRQIAGLSLWLDASDSKTLFQSSDGTTPATANSDPVGYWGDKSGNGRHVTQATSANRPVLTTNAMNGKPTITLDGTNDVLTNTAAGSAGAVDSSFFVVMRTSAGGASEDSPLGVGAINQIKQVRSLYRAGSGTTLGFTSWGNDLSASSASLDIGNAHHVFSARQSGQQVQIGRNGVRDSYTLPAAPLSVISNTVFVGGIDSTRLLQGSIAEALVFYRAISDSETSRLEVYLAWKWGLQQSLPWNHPYAVSFPGYGSQAVVTDSDARAYLTAVAAADGGTGVEVCVARAIDDFVIQCKSAGIWNAIKASCILCGARTLAGALVPLAGTAPTNNNFVAGDYSRKTGLVGNGSSKYLDSNRNRQDDGQDDSHAAIFSSAAPTNGYAKMIGAGGSTGRSVIAHGGSQTNCTFSHGSTSETTTTSGLINFLGVTRSSASSHAYRMNGTAGTANIGSQTRPNLNWHVFNQNPLSTYSNGRLAFYSIGSSLDLATLDTRVSALYHGITYALNTGLSPLGYDTDTLAYLNAGYAAGGTLA